MGDRPIFIVFHTVTIDTMLNNKRCEKRARAKKNMRNIKQTE